MFFNRNLSIPFHKLTKNFSFLIAFCVIPLNTLNGQNTGDCEFYNRYSAWGTPTKEKGKDYLITISDHKKDTSFIWGIVSNCFSQHYHFAEYHDPNLYVIKRYPVSTSTWDDELWMISKPDSMMIEEGIGMDFRVNKKQTLVAFENGDLSYLFIKNLQTDSFRKIKIVPDSLDFSLTGMIGWANNNTEFWGSVFQAGLTYYFFKYDYNTNNISYYPSPIGFLAEYSLNPDLGLLLYSDFPFYVDVVSYQNFIKSGATVSLYLYEFNNDKKQTLLTNKTKEFDPEWICPDFYEYNAPDSEKRVKTKIK